MHFFGVSTEGYDAEHILPVWRKDGCSRITELLSKGCVHSVSRQENGHTFFQYQANSTGTHVSLSPAIARNTTSTLKVLDEIRIAYDVEYIAILICKGHAKPGIFQEPVEAI